MSARYRLLTAGALDSGALAAWRSIQARAADFGSPYFCPEFTLAVASVRPDVRIVAIENGSQPVGFFPHQRMGFGVGRPVGGPLSDYHGVLAAPDSEWDLVSLMRAARLNIWNFDHLVGDPRRFAPCIEATAASPQIDVRSGYERYVEERRAAGSDYIPKTEGLARKCARERGDVAFAWHDPDDEALERLFEWKSEQYRRSGIPDGFAVPWTRQLIRRICREKTDSFAGICSTLRVAGRIIAVHFGIRSRGILHYWFPAYDPAFAKFSVGSILLLRVAAAAQQHGVGVIDLGKGSDPYKQRLMTGSVPLYEGCVVRPSLAGYGRRLRRFAEASANANVAAAALLNLPLRAWRRLERRRRFS